MEHEIQLVSDAPLPNIGIYRNSITKNKEIKQQVTGLLENSVIKLSRSPYSSPVVLVPKRDGGWQMHINYHTLNKITIKNHYLLSHIDNLLDQLKYAKIFTKLDLKSGYHQVQV